MLEPREELLGAIERTVSAGNARFEVSHEITPAARSDDDFPSLFRSLREDGFVLTAFVALFRVVGLIVRLSKKGRRARTQERDWTPDAAQGVIDFVQWRTATDFVFRASIEAEGQEWAGAHGERLTAIEPRAPLATGPLWLLSLLRGATEVTADGDEIVEGIPCRRFAVRADLGLAAAASKLDLAVPPVKRFSELSRLPASTSVDADGRLRRLRYCYDDGHTQAITLLDFGSAAIVDWSRLPRFRSPTRRPAYVVAEPRAPR